jgi:hypothetical protein
MNVKTTKKGRGPQETWLATGGPTLPLTCGGRTRSSL